MGLKVSDNYRLHPGPLCDLRCIPFPILSLSFLSLNMGVERLTAFKELPGLAERLWV